MRQLSLSLIAALFSFTQSSAQSPVHPCGANDLDKALAGHPDPMGERQRIAQADAELEAFTAQWAAENSGAERVVYTIPVVFHIIHNNGPENISDAQVIDAVRILNEDFNKLNPDWPNVRPDFLPLVADVGVEFKLAKRDPQGNCTNGITRTLSALTNDGTQTMKNLIQWPRNKYLNIWVAASADGAAGYTYRPSSVNNQPTWDGIVILHDYTGAIGTGSVGRSRALTHEVGHWINLAHTWGNSNTPGDEDNCGMDDSVQDTPNTIGWTYCAINGTSCGSLDNVENYMEYSYCCKMFTEGQKTRMIAALNSGTAQRNQLHTASNLAATGANDAPTLCQAAFGSSARLVCAGSPITFTDLSFHGVTGWQWDFPGATPATAEEAQATVTYSEPGVYPVSLTVSDGTANLTTTANAYITVLANPGEEAPVTEGFESLSALNGPEWFTLNGNNDNTFQLTSTAAYTGAKSVRVLNTTAMAGNTDELLSRTFDLIDAEAVSISFRWAYARRSTSTDDILSLHISNDCGENWLLRRIMRGSTTLPTAPATTSSFVPNGPEQWGQTTVTNIGATSHIANFRFKFVFESDGGNNLYIDDINLNGMPVGVEELSAGGALQVLPNPAQGQARVRIELPHAAPVRLQLADATGRQVLHMDLGTRSGEVLHPIPLHGLAPGTYLIRAEVDGAPSVVRLIID
ncbi:MAG: PKD domain-containing protein [Flavobacteriales bacterium]|jgi:plastocyanin|nr:PKD domain-containing protein [Flavobacteriales bacterium]